MIDCSRNGRLIAGFVRGIPPEYIWYGVNPEESRGRFEEAYNLIMTAWTEPVWSHEGRVLPTARTARSGRDPVQQPHPPIWIAARSAESIEWCVKRHLPIAQVYQTTGQIEDTFSYYRQVASEEGWDATPDEFILCRHIYIDESDKRAREIVEPAMRYFFTVFNRGFNEAINKGAVDQTVDGGPHRGTFFQLLPRRQSRALRFFQARLGWPDQLRLSDRRQPRQRRATDSQPDEANRRQSLHGHVPHRQLDHDKVINSLNLFKKEIMPRLH